MADNQSDTLNVARRLRDQLKDRDLNEADTRHQIIDVLIHDVLCWPKNMVSCEEYIAPGYTDYVLKNSSDDYLLFIEAKKEGFYFNTPIPHNGETLASYIPIKKLITDNNIKSAMNQVKTYCFEMGCEFACITNGHEWLFFKTFEKGKRWDTIQAYVIRNLAFFTEKFTEAINIFNYTAITEKSSLPILLNSTYPKDRSVYFPKEKISSYDHSIKPNRLALKLRPIIKNYFGVITDEDHEFMENCYVSLREYHYTQEDMREVLHDSLSPYFEEYGVQQLDDAPKGGKFGGKLSKNIRKDRKSEVVILFGGKGAGKSTFLKRLLYHNPPRWLKSNSIISIVDLLETPEKKDIIHKKIWTNIVEIMDIEGLLELSRESLIANLFQDRFEIAEKQLLFGLDKNSEAYNLKLNEAIQEWKNDNEYCAKRLVAYWNLRSKGIIVVIDNTDQYSNDIQDFCFTSAQEISKKLGCLVVISMREERFHNSKIHGLLDAFQNSGFHISSPDPTEVFKKRLDYVIDLMSNEEKRKKLIKSLNSISIKDYLTYLSILRNDMNKADSPLREFLMACSHGDTRMALDLFRSFVLSGYTNVDEMVNAGDWVFRIHQVIKPVMTPKRYFYEETLSGIPNIFQLRYRRRSSHFTSLRILDYISERVDTKHPSYFPISSLKGIFLEQFMMSEDFNKNLDILLKHGFVEANNRIDYYHNDVDSIKITNYGIYMLRSLASEFTYIDLISTDCGVFDEQFCNYLRLMSGFGVF